MNVVLFGNCFRREIQPRGRKAINTWCLEAFYDMYFGIIHTGFVCFVGVFIQVMLWWKSCMCFDDGHTPAALLAALL